MSLILFQNYTIFSRTNVYDDHHHLLTHKIFFTITDPQAFYRESIVRFGGIDLILKIIHLWEKDESLPALLLKLLLQLLKVSVVSEQIIKSGGKETIERIIEIHEEDKEVRADGRKLLRHLELVAKNIAIRDIG